MSKSGLALAFAVALGATGAAAQGRPPAMAAMDRCRAETDSAKRLACFDAAAAGLADAEAKKDIVVMDRAESDQARRKDFGLNQRRREERAEAPAIDEVQSIVTAARQLPYGEWVVTIANSGVWRQVGTDEVGREPKPGVRVRLKRGLLGNFFMKLEGGRQVSVRRAR